MADDTIIRTLTDSEREVLALCGITRDGQLAELSLQSLQKEVAAAAAFFPDAHSDLPSAERLAEISRNAIEAKRQREQAATVLRPDRTGLPMDSNTLQALAGPAAVHRRSEATGRMLVVDDDAKVAEGLDDRRKKDDPRGFSHAICNSRPFSVYLAAWSTLALAAAVILMLIGVFGLLLGLDYNGPGMPLAYLLCAIFVFYVFMERKATCSTCRIQIFSFRNYPRHRKAHHIPLLGHTLSTALSVIFLLRFRCPSCGTPQKLLGHSHGRRRHHKH